MEIKKLGKSWEDDFRAISASEEEPLEKLCVNLDCFRPINHITFKDVKVFSSEPMKILNSKNKVSEQTMSLKIESKDNKRVMILRSMDENQNIETHFKLRISDVNGFKDCIVVDGNEGLSYKFKIRHDKVCAFKEIKKPQRKSIEK